jgi:hypothetical protein
LAGVLQHVVKEKPNAVVPFFGNFLLTTSRRRRSMSMYAVRQKFPSCGHSYKLHQRIPANYTTKFRELSETTYLVKVFVRESRGEMSYC